MFIISLPDGRRINMDNVKSYIAQPSSLDFHNQDGTVTSYALQLGAGLVASSGMASQIDDYAASYNPTSNSTVKTIVESPYQIISISPTSFDVSAGGGANLTITGLGFDSATIGNIYFDDVAGGTDSDGYYFNCSYVSPTQITAVYGGDGAVPVLGGGSVLVYYKDSNAVMSNVINGYNPSGTTVII